MSCSGSEVVRQIRRLWDLGLLTIGHKCLVLLNVRSHLQGVVCAVFRVF